MYKKLIFIILISFIFVKIVHCNGEKSLESIENIRDTKNSAPGNVLQPESDTNVEKLEPTIKETRLSSFNCRDLKINHTSYNETLKDIKKFYVFHNKNVCNKTSINCDETVSSNINSNDTKALSESCTKLVRFNFIDAMGICKINMENPPDGIDNFIIELIANTIYYFCHTPKPNDLNEFYNFADFLYLNEYNYRDTFCTDMYENDEINQYECIQEDSFKDLCMDTESLKFTHHLLSIVTEDIIMSMNLNPDEYKNKSLLEPFSKRGQYFDTYLNKLSSLVQANKEVKSLRALTRVLKIPLSRELVTSNLMMNNFGRALRQLRNNLNYACNKSVDDENYLRTLQLQCEPKPRFLRNNGTISLHDFDMLFLFENIHVSIRCILILLILFFNLYTNCVLMSTKNKIKKTLVNLIQCLLLTNYLFILSDFWIVYESFNPIIAEKKGGDFPYDEDYDFDLFHQSTFYVCMESVRMILGYRYESKNETKIMWILLIVQNVLLNLSRVYSATLLLSIICYILYEYRKSFLTTVSSTIRMILKIILVLWLIIATFTYMYSGYKQYNGIRGISESLPPDLSMQLTNSTEEINVKMANERLKNNTHLSVMPLTNNTGDIASHRKLHNETRKYCQTTDSLNEDTKDAGTRYHNYTVIIFFCLISVTTFILLGYYIVQKIVSHYVPYIDREEMERTVNGLFTVTIIYIITNSIIIYYEYLLIYINNKDEGITNDGIVDYTVKYHWFHLLTFIDPLIHPVVIIFGIKAMRTTHKKWRREIKLFKFSNFCRIIIIRIYRVFDPDLCDDSIYQRFSLRSNQVSDDVNKSLFEEKASRYRVASLIDNDDIRNRLTKIKQKHSY